MQVEICKCCGKPKKKVTGVNPNNRDRSEHVYNSVGNVGSNAVLTQPATPAASEWDGWGTALKPAWEPIIVARKPLVESSIDIVQAVEYNMRKNGLQGEIRWIPEHVRRAEKQSLSANSIQIKPRTSAVEISVESASANVMQSTESDTGKNYASVVENGTPQIKSGQEKCGEKRLRSYAMKSSTHTAESVHVAERRIESFLPSIISTVTETNIERKSATRTSIEICEKETSPQDLESSAGTVTVLSGDTVTVHTITFEGNEYKIEQLRDGSFVWPDSLPMSRPGGRTLTVAENVQRYGTGAMNIDACRIETTPDDRFGGGGLNSPVNGFMANTEHTYQKGMGFRDDTSKGRWPANLIHDGSAEVLAGFPVTSSGGALRINKGGKWDTMSGAFGPSVGYRESDTGSAARFFYCAKASKQDRDEGCEGFDDNPVRANIKMGVRECNVCGSRRNDKIPFDTWPSCGHENWKWAEVSEGGSRGGFTRNHHPTVKPTSLMRYLCRLVTPPQGVILDPFMGSGSTGKAAMLEGFNFIGIDTEIEYVEIAARRIEHACEKVGIVIDQPMMFETRRETADRPKQLMLL